MISNVLLACGCQKKFPRRGQFCTTTCAYTFTAACRYTSEELCECFQTDVELVVQQLHRLFGTHSCSSAPQPRCNTDHRRIKSESTNISSNIPCLRKHMQQGYGGFCARGEWISRSRGTLSKKSALTRWQPQGGQLFQDLVLTLYVV